MPDRIGPMGDLGIQTAVHAIGDGFYEGTPSAEWEIWGPMGGYIASFALRAAGMEGEGRTPTAFACHYLGVAKFEPVQVRVETRKGGRAATSQRVEITQDGRPILDASVWSIAPNEGPEHDETTPPDVPDHTELKTIEELVDEGSPAPFPFWENFDAKPIDFELEWPPDGPRPARWRDWLRFRPTPTYDDPWIDACRSVILVDIASWPAAHRPHAWQSPPYIAPTLDLSVAFHQSAAAEDWLLVEGTAPLSTEGLFGWTARVWSSGGMLHASGGGQCLYRKVPPQP
jgi:acyl-CoA thioesterase-2